MFFEGRRSILHIPAIRPAGGGGQKLEHSVSGGWSGLELKIRAFNVLNVFCKVGKVVQK